MIYSAVHIILFSFSLLMPFSAQSGRTKKYPAQDQNKTASVPTSRTQCRFILPPNSTNLMEEQESDLLEVVEFKNDLLGLLQNNLKAAHILLKNGASITGEIMRASAVYGDGAFLNALVERGGNLIDNYDEMVALAFASLREAYKWADQSSPRDSEDCIRAASALIWLLEHGTLSEENRKTLIAMVESEGYPLLTQYMKFRPLFYSLLCDQLDEARDLIAQLPNNQFASPTALADSALDLVAANGNLDMLNLILNSFPMSRHGMEFALQAAIIQKQFATFMALIERIIKETDCRRILEQALITASVQGNENMVRYLLNLDSEHSLNLSVYPALSQLVSLWNIEADAEIRYAYMYGILAGHVNEENRPAQWLTIQPLNIQITAQTSFLLS